MKNTQPAKGTSFNKGPYKAGGTYGGKGGSTKISTVQPPVKSNFVSGPYKKNAGLGASGGKANDPGDMATHQSATHSYGSRKHL